ncbi:uncharacterized protein [Nicotiana tomentosiformis]|uniref:uncharacterized protein n=1 Tax=Nicotiana tomentosiformis TaxID=4098 RepID=UPI00388CC3AD
MCPPVKQKLRKFKTDMSLKIKEEVTKKIKANVLRVVKYPTWFVNIVPVPKKDGKVRICVDYRDLNRASPKDDFPLPNKHILIDNCANHELQFFVDCFARYHQILMDEEDAEKTAFITPWGKYCYKMISFGLKNAGATYMRSMTNHLPLHDTQGNRGIELDPSKVKAIQDLPPLKNKKEKAVKGQALANHLAENPIDGEYEPLKTYFPDEEVSLVGEDITEVYDDWRVFFDGTVNFEGVDIRAVLVSETGRHYPVSAELRFSCTNNMTEYEACILGLRLDIDINVQELLIASSMFISITNARYILTSYRYHPTNLMQQVHPVPSPLEVEAASYKAVTKKVVVDFVRDHIVCWFGVPKSIITDNAANLNSNLMKAMCETFKIKHQNSTTYRL